MRILLTRPRSDDDLLPGLLLASGHTVLADPLLAIEFLPPPGKETETLQAVVATSSNALRAVHGWTALKSLLHLPLFAVGSATATSAREAGFQAVIEGPGTGTDLVPFMQARLRPDGGGILYLRGEEVAFDMAPALAAVGLQVHDAVVYRAVAAASLAPATLKALRHGKIDGVVLLSPRTAAIYAGLILQANLMQQIARVHHFCLSIRVAPLLSGLGTVITHCPSHPNLQELVALIDRDVTHSPLSQ